MKFETDHFHHNLISHFSRYNKKVLEYETIYIAPLEKCIRIQLYISPLYKCISIHFSPIEIFTYTFHPYIKLDGIHFFLIEMYAFLPYKREFRSPNVEDLKKIRSNAN